MRQPAAVARAGIGARRGQRHAGAIRPAVGDALEHADREPHTLGDRHGGADARGHAKTDPEADAGAVKSYTSKKYHYKISYPPDWIVTPGSGNYSDEFDNFVYPYLYVYRDVVPSGYYVAVSKAMNQRIAYFKSHYHASVVSNKSIKVNGWPGRIAILKGKDGVVNLQIQELILAKGRIGYELELMGQLDAAAADKALFKRIYSSWHPT